MYSHSQLGKTFTVALGYFRVEFTLIALSPPSLPCLCPLSNNWLTPYSRVLPEKLTVPHLVKKFPAFYEHRKFITVFASARHLSLISASSIQFMPHPTCWRCIITLSSHLRLGLPSGVFPSGLPTKTLYKPLLSPIRATCPAHLILLDLISRAIFGEQCWSYSS